MILIIALGIGTTTAVFSVVDRLLFRSLPYPESDRLVSLGITIPMMDGEFLMANDYLNLKEHETVEFSAVTSWTGMADCDLTEDSPQRLACAQVDSTFCRRLELPGTGAQLRSSGRQAECPEGGAIVLRPVEFTLRRRFTRCRTHDHH